MREEAQRRWGHTEAYRESASRVAKYGEADWQAIRAEADQIAREFAELLRLGEPPSGERARAAVERHRAHISRWFYPCSAEMHTRLADTYVNDKRFARNYERHARGLAGYVRDAIVASGGGEAPTRR